MTYLADETVIERLERDYEKRLETLGQMILWSQGAEEAFPALLAVVKAAQTYDELHRKFMVTRIADDPELWGRCQAAEDELHAALAPLLEHAK